MVSLVPVVHFSSTNSLQQLILIYNELLANFARNVLFIVTNEFILVTLSKLL